MIEGCLPENNIQRFSDKLKEGLLYEIESFIVVGARNNYRVADHAFRIKIGQQTKITEIDPPLEDFPYYAYDAKPFEVLEKRIKKTDTLSGAAPFSTLIPCIASFRKYIPHIYLPQSNCRCHRNSIQSH